MNELESSSNNNRLPPLEHESSTYIAGDKAFVYALGPRARGVITPLAIAHAATSMAEMPSLDTSKAIIEALRAEVHNTDKIFRKLAASSSSASSS